MPGLQEPILGFRGPIPSSRGPIQAPMGSFESKVVEKRLVFILGEGPIRPGGSFMATFTPSLELWLRRLKEGGGDSGPGRYGCRPGEVALAV